MHDASLTYRNGEAVAKRLLKDNPDDIVAKGTLASLLSKRGEAASVLGNVRDAVAAHRASLEMYNDVASRSPSDREFRRGRAV